MKILLVQDTDWIERGPHQQHHLMERLSLRGHSIRVVDYEFMWKKKEYTFFSRRVIKENISKYYEGGEITLIRPPLLRIPIGDYISTAYFQYIEIQRQVIEFKPDIVVGFGILGTYFAAIISKKNKIPFVYYWIDVLHELIPVNAFKPLGKYLEIKSLKLSKVILVINEKLREYIFNIGIDRNLIKIVGAGIDLDHFKITGNREIVRESLGFLKDDIVLFFMGWLYNFSGLKEIMLELAKFPISVRMLIIGEGDAYEELCSLRDMLNLKKRVILTGKLPYHQMPMYIEAADICILPAYPWEKIMQEIVPIKVYEYMALGKPIISTKLSGIIKEFGFGNGVFYVDRPENVPREAVKLFNDKLAYNEACLKSTQCVGKSTWNKITDDFEKILKEIIP